MLFFFFFLLKKPCFAFAVRKKECFSLAVGKDNVLLQQKGGGVTLLSLFLNECLDFQDFLVKKLDFLPIITIEALKLYCHFVIVL